MTLPFLQSSPGQEPVVLQRAYNVDAATLFRAWTTPHEIKQWFGAGKTNLATAYADARTGGEWRFAFAEADGKQDVLSGEYIEVVQNVRLVFTWQHTRFIAGECSEQTARSLVTVNFTASAATTVLELRHEQIIRERGRLGVANGWSISFGKLAGHVDQDFSHVHV